MPRVPTAWLDHWLAYAADALGTSTFVLNPLVAVVLLGITCGLVGSVVVSGRLAFFSDAVAHTAFAGVALAVLGVVVFAGVRDTRGMDDYAGLVQAVMVAVGVVAGAGMVFVRERTGLATDTVIGVFFALAIGLAAMVLPAARARVNVDPDQFLFGSVVFVRGRDILELAALLAVTATVVGWRYNGLALGSFSPTLARSRGVNVRLNNYLFVILLAVVVNVAIRSVGALLINALLVVPTAAAANVGRNLREVFWLALVFTVGASVAGLEVSRTVSLPLGRGVTLDPAPGGTIVVLCVGLFAASLAVAWRRGRLTRAAADRGA